MILRRALPWCLLRGQAAGFVGSSSRALATSPTTSKASLSKSENVAGEGVVEVSKLLSYSPPPPPKLTDENAVFVTTPIFYVNAAPHIGHLHSAVLADALKIWFQVRSGRNARSVLSTGTDEHGYKIQRAAAKMKSPIEFCNVVSGQFKNLFDRANIRYDDFIRTTQERHMSAVARLWTKVYEKGYIYKGIHEGWYSVSDETFVASTDIIETVDSNGQTIRKSKDSGHLLEWVVEENYKFKLSLFQDRVLDWLRSNPSVILPENKLKELTSLVESGVTDLSVSRTRQRLQWGIPVPNDPDHVIYVWFDALTNYWTVAQDHGIWPPTYHVVGKDILKFHGLFWPAFLMAAELPLPDCILAHSHWMVERKKMSKSLGNVVDPHEIIGKYGNEIVRYFLLRDGGLSEDGNFVEEHIAQRYNTDLANKFGNLLQRMTSATINPMQIVPASPDVDARLGSRSEERELVQLLEAIPDRIDNLYRLGEFGRGIEILIAVASEANKFVTAVEPWNLRKQADEISRDRLRRAIRLVLETVRIIATLLQPVIPEKSSQTLDRLGVPLSRRGLADARLWHAEDEPRRLGVNEEMIFRKL